MAKAQVRARSGSTPGAAKRSSRSKAPSGEALAQHLDATLSGIDSLEARLEAIHAAIPGRITFSTSLGLEDQAVLHAVAATGRAFDVFTLDTGRHFPETLETLEASELRYAPLKIRVVFPDAADVEMLVARDGIMGFRQSIEARKACCDVRKVRPLNKALAGAAGWITGLRRDQSAGRAHVPFAAWDGEHKLVKLNPIADWSLEKLEAYIADNAIPVNALHARGFPSIGCQPCTRAIRPGEDIRAGRWWWENEDGKECGLHNRPKPKEAHA
ncbi:MAG: phosphoadenylyl-sulfate reductase [Hyphomicrobium sp.]|uniref:phosphoadenylyl-sulfate reductase n=1 Tax=Hyphomicrobium sp. TaxID=82 RepID=UPI003D0A6445